MRRLSGLLPPFHNGDILIAGMAAEAAFLYPVALDVRGRICVVVGGGAVGSRRVAGLLDSEARVIVVSPEIRSDSLRERIDSGSVSYKEEMFLPTHLDGAFIAVAATDRPEVNSAVASAARSRGVLLNMAAPAAEAGSPLDEDGGDFATMAAVRRQDLIIGITTGGAGPALTARLRRELESQFGPEWTPYVSLLREMRAQAKTLLASESERAEALRRLATRASVLEMLAAGDEAGARREALSCLS